MVLVVLFEGRRQSEAAGVDEKSTLRMWDKSLDGPVSRAHFA
jgi:hypothetical protein